MQELKLDRNDDDRWLSSTPSGELRVSSRIDERTSARPTAWLRDCFSEMHSEEETETASAIRSMTEMLCWLGCVGACTLLLASIYLTLGAATAPNAGRNALNHRPADVHQAGGAVITGSTQRVTGLVEPKSASASTSEQAVGLQPGLTTMAPRDPALLAKAGSGEVFRDRTAAGAECPHCPEVVVVPAGAFLLGRAQLESLSEDWQRPLETPQVKVIIAKPFAVGRYAVTFDEWDACVSEGGCTAMPSDNGWGRGKRPVINVSWLDANSFAAWLSHKTGRPYRLLSETEREYAARAGTTTPFSFGTAPSPKRANYSWDRTLPVNSIPPNAWGLYHVHGNVSDWTADCWNPSHKGHPGNAEPRLTGNCSRRVVRGGSWFNGPSLIRSASRSGLSGDAQYKTVGFRVARAIAAGDSD